MAKKKRIPDANDTSLSARLARLETHLLQREEDRVRAEEAKAKRKEESQKRSMERTRKMQARNTEVKRLVAAEMEKLCPEGWSVLEDDLRIYNEVEAEGYAMRQAIKRFGSQYEVQVAQGFEDSAGHYYGDDDEPITLVRSTSVWFVFGKPHPRGQSYVQCPRCQGVGSHLKSRGRR